MIILISDIHFTDNTAFPSYLPARTFEKVFFQNVVSILKRRETVKDLTIVFLGDIFDLIRTREWWGIRQGKWVPKKVTPWSENRDGLEDSALKVLKNIIKRNKETIKAIKELPDRLIQEVSHLKTVKMVYVPGNHDRMIVMPTLWDFVKESLGSITLEKTGFYHPKGYNTLAFHGHQLDMMNRENKDIPPFGDFISSLVTAIPYWMERVMQQENIKPKVIEKFKNKMLRIDDVRPQSAILKWLILEVEKERSDIKNFLKKFIFKVLRQVADDPFLKRWMEAHDKELGIYDEIFGIFMRLRGLLALGERFLTLEHLLNIIEKLHGEQGKDTYAVNLLKACNGEFTKKDNPFESEVQQKIKDADCLVIGHTHGAKYLPLNGKVSYINTGTWRKYALQSLSGREFISSHRMTFVAVYKVKEAGDRRFEQWNGLMKEE